MMRRPLLTALLLASCGTEFEGTEEPSTAPDAPVAADAASLPDPGDRGFVLAGNTSGLPSVTARVLTGSDGDIAVDAYPTRARVLLRHGLLPLDYAGAFEPEFCGEVAAIAAESARGSDFADQAARLLRRGGSPTAHLPISPFVGPAFEAALARTARAAGYDIAAPRLVNPLVLSEVRVTLLLDAGALTRSLGVDDIEATLRQRLALQQTFALRQGTLVVALPGKDLWCDLAAGRAQIELTLRGTVAGEPFGGTTTVTGVAPL